MKTIPNCPKCGAAQSTGALEGLCPECIIRATLDTLVAEETSAGHVAGVRPPEARDAADTTARPPRLRYFGDYELIEELAQGGMGVVYRARQISLNRLVAVKMIGAGLLAGDAEVKRFHAEAEAVASLDHPNIVPLYEVGEHGGQHYFAMKMIEGGSLASRTANGKFQIPNDNSAKLLSTVARAIHYAHQRGILHRDLKPGNILVDAVGEPHVTDFGLAKRLTNSALGTRNSELTLSGAVLGTPSYMSPEQASGNTKQITTATDVYSLGTILYELLAGRPPFTGGSTLVVLRKVMEEEPVRPSQLRSSRSEKAQISPGGKDESLLTPAATRVDRDLETICLKCLEKDPTRRYGSAAELADDLDRFLRDEPIRARPSTGPERVIKWGKRYPAIALLSTALVITFFGAFIAVVALWRRAEHETKLVRQTAQREAAALLRNEVSREAFVGQARAYRTSSQMGQRVKALQALAAAARIRPTLDLRNEAIAALALPDLTEDAPILSFHEPAYNVAFDADVRTSVHLGTDGRFYLTRLADLAGLTNWPANSPCAGWLTFSPDGHRLAGRSMEEAAFWSVGAATVSQRFPARFGMNYHHALEFSPDNRLLAIADGQERISLVSVETGETIQSLEAGPGVDAFKFSPDGRHLAVRAGRSLQIWRLPEGALVEKFQAPAVRWLDWQEDGARLALALADGKVLVMELVNGTISTLTSSPIRGVDRAVFHPGGGLLAADLSYGLGMRLWEVATGRLWFTLPDTLADHFSHDGTRLATCKGQPAASATAWSVVEGGELRSLAGPPGAVRDLDVTRDGRWLTAACDDGVRLWKLASGQQLDFAPLTNVTAVQFSSDGKYVLVKLGKERSRLPLEMKDRRFYNEIGFGLADATAGDSGSGILEPTQAAVRSSTPIPVFSVPPRPAAETPTATSHRAISSQAGLTAEIALARRIKLSDLGTGEFLAELEPPDDTNLEQLFLSHDGQRVMTVNKDRIIQVWDLPRLRAELAKLNLDWGASNAHALAPLVNIPEPLTNSIANAPTSQRSWRREAFDSKGFPRRDPKATVNQIDLKDWYNASLTENWLDPGAQRNNSLDSLPRGLQKMAGVTFDVRGIVQLDSTVVRLGFPKQVQGIPVKLRCARLHFLGAVHGGFAKPGTDAARCVIHYADGQAQEITWRLGQEIAGYWQEKNPASEAPLGQIAWRGVNEASAYFQAGIQLSKWTWENARPGVEVKTLDFLSAGTAVAPFLIAITAE